MLQDTTEIPITLSLARWQIVLALLGKGPWEVVDPILKAIVSQLMKQGAMSRANGSAEAPSIGMEKSNVVPGD